MSEIIVLTNNEKFCHLFVLFLWSRIETQANLVLIFLLNSEEALPLFTLPHFLSFLSPQFSVTAPLQIL